MQSQKNILVENELYVREEEEKEKEKEKEKEREGEIIILIPYSQGEDSWFVSQIVGGGRANKLCCDNVSLGLRPTGMKFT